MTPLRRCNRAKLRSLALNLSAFLVLTACARRAPGVDLNVATAVPVPVSAPTVQSKLGQLRIALDAVMQYPSGKPAFSFDGVPGVAPTMRVRPGDTIFFTLHNRLPPTNYTPDDVNVHFHGLDVSPNAPQDNVITTLAKPGQTIKYVLHIPKTQQPGLYWYHPHSHGEAYWQVVSGMSGALVVEGIRQRIPEVASLRQQILVLRDVQDRPSIFGVPWSARPGIAALERAAARKLGVAKYQSKDPDDAPYGGACSPEKGMHVTIDGTQAGAIAIAPGERQLLRVVNASPGRVFDLALDGGNLGLVAVDGYPVSAYPGTPHVVWLNHIVLPPGGRAEFIVIGQDRETLLRSRCYDSGPAGDRDPAIVLATLQPRTRASHNLPKPLGNPKALAASVFGTVPVGPPSRSRVVVFTEDANGYYINHQRFDMMSMKPMFTIRDGTLERWTVENDTDEVHAFHIHQIHFTVLSVNGKAPAIRFWQDTVIVPPQRHVGRKVIPGRITLLMDFRSPLIKGVFPFHCHMLDHEDGGMMALVRVI